VMPSMAAMMSSSQVIWILIVMVVVYMMNLSLITTLAKFWTNH